MKITFRVKKPFDYSHSNLTTYTGFPEELLVKLEEGQKNVGRKLLNGKCKYKGTYYGEWTLEEIAKDKNIDNVEKVFEVTENIQGESPVGERMSHMVDFLEHCLINDLDPVKNFGDALKHYDDDHNNPIAYDTLKGIVVE